MKKNLFLSAFIFCAHFSFSQTIGLKSGINFSNISNLSGVSHSIKTGFYGGAFAEFPIGNDHFLVRPEILYSKKGCSFGPTDMSHGGKLRLNYISVPLLAGYKFTRAFGILLGPEFNFLTAAHSKIAGEKIILNNIYQKFDMAVDLGATYIFCNKFGIDVRYSYGFKDLLKGQTTDSNGDPIGTTKSGSNRVIQLGLSYSLSKSDCKDAIPNKTF